MDGDNGSDLVTYAEAARRVVAAGLAEHMARQRVRQLHRGQWVRLRSGERRFTPPDPNFPLPEIEVDRVVLFSWEKLHTYFEQRDAAPGIHKGWVQAGRS
jgi:hypothetical protein